SQIFLHQNKKEIKQLKDQIALLRATVQQLSLIVQAFIQQTNGSRITQIWKIINERIDYNINGFYYRVGLKLTFKVKEIKEARKITNFIVIGGDWNAHHSAWFDKDIDDIGESLIDFIINNNLQILNSSPFDHTYEKDGKKSSIDITLCSESISRWCSNWRTDNDELDVHSDYLLITFNIKKIETWNLRSDKWNSYRQILESKLDEWKKNLQLWNQDDKQLLDCAVDSWTNCVVEPANKAMDITEEEIIE
ncbi:endonuclease/reverse transcriptase, partial [Reticulomyxa filosa]